MKYRVWIAKKEKINTDSNKETNRKDASTVVITQKIIVKKQIHKILPQTTVEMCI